MVAKSCIIKRILKLSGFIIFIYTIVKICFESQNTSSNSLQLKNNYLVLREMLEEKVSLLNTEEKIKNEELFGKSDNYTAVIIVQVHKRRSYLQNLIKSLEDTTGIREILLIFSHDYYDEDVNQLIDSIKFCKVMQMFYPHSLQIYSDTFPGDDLNDCKSNMSIKAAIRSQCRNAFYADSYGKYRSPYLVETKHHWWWKANRVFDLTALKNYNGSVLFLEEDNYVLRDLLHVLKLMENLTKRSCKKCKVLALANNIINNNSSIDYWEASIVAKTNELSNLGIVLNRDVWLEIVQCKHWFCFYDDYNFDLSLRNVLHACMNNKQHLVLYASRVFRLGSCRSYYRTSNCPTIVDFEDIAKLQQEKAHYLFPKSLQIFSKKYKLFQKVHGEWGDPRDQALCLGMAMI